MLRPNEILYQSKDNEHEHTKLTHGIESSRIILPPAPSLTMTAFDKGLQPGACFVDDRLLSVNGWLAPSGVLYTCRWREHDLAISLFDAESRLELLEKQYVPLSQMRFNLKYLKKDINSELIETIHKWHSVNNLNPERFETDYAKWEAIYSGA